jgi:hypothetical protein
MTIKFEFTLEDSEAETLVELLNNERQRMINESRKALITGPEERRQSISDRCLRRSEYVDYIKKKVLSGNTRVNS